MHYPVFVTESAARMRFRNEKRMAGSGAHQHAVSDIPAKDYCR